MDQYRIKDIRYSYIIGCDSDISARMYVATGSNSIAWFLYDLENMSTNDLKIIKDRINADIERIGKGTDIKEIKKELPLLDKDGDVDVTAFLKRFKEENLNAEKA